MRRIVTNSDTEQTVEGSSGVAKAGLTTGIVGAAGLLLNWLNGGLNGSCPLGGNNNALSS